MRIWEVVDNEYFVNLDNVTFIECSEDGEFEIGFVGGKSQSFTTETPKRIFAQAVRTQLGAINLEKEEDEDIADSEKLSKPEPAWRAVLGE